MDKFEIGEVAIAISDKHSTTECEIVSGLIRYEGELGHDIRINNNLCDKADSVSGEWFCGLPYLRKKKPPKEPATWQEIQELTNWNPTEQKVEI